MPINTDKYVNFDEKDPTVVVYRDKAVIVPLDVEIASAAQVITPGEGVTGFAPVNVPAMPRALGLSAAEWGGTITDGVYTAGSYANLDFTGIKTVSQSGLRYKFQNAALGFASGVSFPDLETVSEKGMLNTFNAATGFNGGVSLPKLATVDREGLSYCFSASDITYFNAPSIVNLTNLNALCGICSDNRQNLVSFDLSGLETISGDSALKYGFYYCLALTAASFPKLKTISGRYGMLYAFQYCQNLETATMPELVEISSNYGMEFCFLGCRTLSTFSFDKLSVLTGSYALHGCFNNCFGLQTLYFPALKSTSFGGYTNQFNVMLSGCSGVTVHFPSNVQGTIGSWSDVTNGFGGTNTTVLYDLPATEE